MSESLLGRIATGDQPAVREFMTTYGRLVWSVARRFSADPQDAEDAVQEVFIDLWKSAPRFDASKSSEKTFVVMVARRRLIDRMRKRQRQIDSELLPEDFDVATDQHVSIERDTEAAIAAKAFETLRPEQRRVLEMAVIQGMSHGDISESIDMPLGTVKSHIRRGLQTVRDRLNAIESSRSDGGSMSGGSGSGGSVSGGSGPSDGGSGR